MTRNRRILVDNATLSGVERITGTSQTANLNHIDNDILCLEKLVTAILFSDELLGVDDYKTEYRAERLKTFGFIEFIRIDEAAYTSFATEAAEFARNMTFSFEGAKPAGDVAKFFETLRIDPQLRWDVFVSSEYLTLSYLVGDRRRAGYETSIDSVFRNEIGDRIEVAAETDCQPTFGVAGRSDIEDVKDLVHELASNNPRFKREDGKSALNRLLFGYGWVAERSYFYNAVAREKAADAYLAPLRDAFCESCCRIDHPSQVTSLLERLKARSQETLSSILEPTGRAKFAMRLPFFTAYLISKVDNPRQCIELALTMRNAPEFQSCRNIFNNLDHLSAADRLQEMNGILRYLNQSCASLMKKYAVSTEGGLSFSLSIGLTGPTLGISTKVDQLFRLHKNQPFSRIFRNIAHDMLNVERLGGLYEKICSSIREHRNAGYSDISKTPKYMENRESEYGRPAKL